MEIIIANIILVIIMLGFSVFIFNNVIKRINQSAKKWFLEKLQEYNYLVEEKENELENLRKQIEEAKRSLKTTKQIQNAPEDIFNEKIEAVLEKMKQYKGIQKEIPRRPEVIYDIPTPQYKEESFFSNYKNLKKKFNLNIEETITKFIKEHKTNEDEQEYKVLLNFCNQFNKKILYECSTLKSEDQYELVKSVLTEEEKMWMKLEDSSINKRQFTILKLIEKLQDRIKKIDPTIYVYVGRESTNYDNLDPQIKTYHYKNMSEGVIIHYKGKMYDYSI